MTSSPENPAAIRQRPEMSVSRQWLLRICAVFFGLGLLVFAEGACRLFGWGQQDSLFDPLLQDVGQPLFVLNAAGDRREIPPSRHHVFAPDGFPARKSPREYRIFVLGGSTVQGRPYSRETAFPTWLRLSLQVADPQREWTVINCGGVSYGTHRLVPLFRECLKYSPDLVVVCTGHNEFLERNVHDGLTRGPVPVLGLTRYLRRLHMYRLGEAGLLALRRTTSPEASKLGRPVQEVDALLDHPGGLEAYQRDLDWHRSVAKRFRENLDEMAEAAALAQVPLLLAIPPSNLKDCPPFKSEHGAGVTQDERRRFRGLLEQARVADPEIALSLCRAALELDNHHPMLHFSLGRRYLVQARFRQAEAHFVAARDEDICPLRMSSTLESNLVDVARGRDLDLIDGRPILAAECLAGIMGSEILVDHVHPSIRGHQLLAEAILPQVAKLAVLAMPENWTQARDRAYQDHLATLDPMYFTRGLRRLRAVEAWAAGRGDPLPVAPTGSVESDSRAE